MAYQYIRREVTMLRKMQAQLEKVMELLRGFQRKTKMLYPTTGVTFTEEDTEDRESSV